MIITSDWIKINGIWTQSHHNRQIPLNKIAIHYNKKKTAFQSLYPIIKTLINLLEHQCRICREMATESAEQKTEENGEKKNVGFCFNIVINKD